MFLGPSQCSAASRVAAVVVVVVALSGCDNGRRSDHRLPHGIEAYPLLPLQRLLAPAHYAAPQISPDGRYLSYIAPLDGVPNLHVLEIGQPGDARPVTHHTDSGVRATDVSGQVMYRWHYDSKQIFYPKDYAGDENWDIHIVDVLSGEDRNLTPMPDQQVEIIAYGRNHPDQALITIEDFGSRRAEVFRLDLVSAERIRVQENDGFIGFLGDNDLRVRLGLRFTPQGGLDFLKLPSGGDARSASLYQVSGENLPGLTASTSQKIIRVDASNERVYLYDAEGRDKLALVSVNLDTGRKEVLAFDDRVDVGGVLYHPISHEPQAYATNWQRTRWHPIDPSVTGDIHTLDEFGEGDWRVLSRTDDDDKWIVEYTLSHKPVEFYLYERQSNSRKLLFTATPQLDDLRLSRLHPFIVSTTDGLDLVSYLMLPPWEDPDEDGRVEQPIPFVVLVHGGPSDERAQFAFGPLLHWLANRGYGVLYVNFRGSAGFGKAFMNGQILEWGARMHQDVLDQVNWAVDEGLADPSRLAVLGGSYGGYEVLVGMTMTPDVFACGIDIVGPSDLENFMPHWDPDTMGKIIGDPRTEQGRALLRARSPVNFAHQTRHPVLIGQGANDSRVPQAQSDKVVEKMLDAGVAVTYVVFPDEGHGFLKPANSMAFNAVMEVFLSECLGGRRQEIDQQINASSIRVPVGAQHIPGLQEVLDQGTSRVE